MVKWLRENTIATGILTVLRLYLGYSWLTAGFAKLTGGFDVNASGFLKDVIANPVKGPDGNVVYGTYLSFLKSFALPKVGVFNTIVPLGEFLVGLGLILECLTTAPMFFGLIMNFSYLMAGTVSHNPSDILLGAIILFAGFNAVKFGLDHCVVPLVRQTVFKQIKPIKQNV
jgi:thiosulfate dehydrogenase [quinone] large subunit